MASTFQIHYLILSDLEKSARSPVSDLSFFSSWHFTLQFCIKIHKARTRKSREFSLVYRKTNNHDIHRKPESFICNNKYTSKSRAWVIRSWATERSAKRFSIIVSRSPEDSGSIEFPTFPGVPNRRPFATVKLEHMAHLVYSSHGFFIHSV